MSTTEQNVAIAVAYYEAMGRKNVSDMEQYLHPDVQFVAPLAKTEGKEAFLEAAQGFCSVFESLTICAKFDDGDKAMIVYELICPEPIGKIRSAALMSFKDDLISCIELFYDARPFVK